MIEADLVLPPQDANRLEQAQRAYRVGIGGVFRGFEGYLHVRLRRQVVDLVRSRLLHDADQVGRVGNVAIVQMKGNAGVMRIVHEMIERAVLKDDERRLMPCTR